MTGHECCGTDISYMRGSREYGEDCVETTKSSWGSKKRQKVSRSTGGKAMGGTCFNGHSALTIVAYKLSDL